MDKIYDGGIVKKLGIAWRHNSTSDDGNMDTGVGEGHPWPYGGKLNRTLELMLGFTDDFNP